MFPERREVSVLVYVVLFPHGAFLLFPNMATSSYVSRQGPKPPSSWGFLWPFSGKIKHSLFSSAHRALFPFLFVALSGCIHRCLKVILSACGVRTASQAFHHPDSLSWSSTQQTYIPWREEWKMPAECHQVQGYMAKPVLCGVSIKAVSVPGSNRP